MVTTVIMPRQGQSVESCVISKWFKKKGDDVKKGDILFAYETDKASFDFESKVDGKIIDVFFGDGEDVPVLTEVCIVGNEGESYVKPGFEFQNNKATVNTVQNTPVSQGTEILEGPISTGMTERDGFKKVRISPRARVLAEKLGIDHRDAVPTGPDGRIKEKDIIVLSEQVKADKYVYENVSNIRGNSRDSDEVKLSSTRKLIAEVMQRSISSTAQLTLNTSFDASEILSFRKKIKENRGKLKLEDITLDDIILYAVSRIILNFKELNAHFLEDKMLYFKNVHLGVAVDMEKGLMVPTLFDANLKSLNEISCEAKMLVEKCRKDAAEPDIFKGASFTVISMDTLGIESFTPVLYPPQTGILGVNTIVNRMKEIDGKQVYYPAKGLSLTFDHRAMDGALAARFLQELNKYLENLSILFSK